MRTDELLAAAIKLPHRERVRLARELLDTLVEVEERGESVQEAWLVEIDRRVKEIREGRVKLEDTETVLQELESELGIARKRTPRKQHRRAR